MSCTNKNEDETTVGQWIDVVYDTLGLQGYNSNKPYYLNINNKNPYFDKVQALYEFGVIDDLLQINTDDILSKEIVAYTLVNIYPDEIKVNNINIKDINKSSYPESIKKCLQIGMLDLDSRSCFNPKKSISLLEAQGYLNMVVEYRNSYCIDENVFSYEYADDLTIINEEPEEIDSENKVMYYPSDSKIKKDDVIEYHDENDNITYSKVDEVIYNDDSTEVHYKDAEYEDIYSNIDLETSFDVDMSKAQIYDLNEDEIIEIEDVPSLTKVLGDDSKTFKFKDYTVKYNVSMSGIKASISKKSNFGANFNAECSLYDIKPTVKWKAHGLTINDSVFKVTFKTNESVGLKRASYKDTYLDYSKIDPSNFLGSITGAFAEKKDVVEEIIPIARVVIPIPSAPVFNISMQLQLHLYTSGRVELSLSNTHRLGMEVVNNNMRLIHDVDRDANFVIKASVNALAGIKFGFNMANVDLMDIALEGGVKAYVDTIVHLYDSDGNVTSQKTDVSADVISDVIDGNDDIKVCADLSAYWVLDIAFNSSKTLLGRLGLRKTIHLFKESNSQIFPNMKTHVENWQFVDKCTRGKRIASTSKPDIIVTDRITIQDYSVALNINETKQIIIKSLPQGYGVSDLVFTSSNTSIVKAEGSNIKGISSGSAIITIKTSDNKYEVKCNVLVKSNGEYV